MNSNNWTHDPSSNIASEQNKTKIRDALTKGYIVLEHMHFGGGTGLDKLLIDEYEDFLTYIETKAKPGDQFVIYAIEDLFDRGLYLLKCKFPDDQGRTPRGGSY
jgi:hypothetical protein